MAYSKENCSLENLQKIIKNFPGYMVFGNQPYQPETLIIKREKGVFTIVQRFDKNYDCLQAMITPGWRPDKPMTKDKMMFDNETYQVNSAKYLLNKYIEILLSAKPLGELFQIKIDFQLMKARELNLKQK